MKTKKKNKKEKLLEKVLAAPVAKPLKYILGDENKVNKLGSLPSGYVAQFFGNDFASARQAANASNLKCTHYFEQPPISSSSMCIIVAYLKDEDLVKDNGNDALPKSNELVLAMQ